MTRVNAAAAGVSVLLHAAAVWLMLPHLARRQAVEMPPTIEIEMVDQAEERRGADAGQVAAAAAAAAARPAERGEMPAPAGPVGAAPASADPAAGGRAAAARAAVNLGGGERDEDSLLVTGDNVVPPRPDATFHNRPPAFPADAARRGAQGVVRLVIHVSEAGVPAGIEVARSSGDGSLDRAALDAVALWRFQPALAGGQAVPFDYSLDIAFRR